MKGSEKNKVLSPQLKLFMWLLVAGWTIVVIASLAWNVDQMKQKFLEMARIQAIITLEKDIIARHWNARHGGVYVEMDKDTPPNPYLSNIPERDIKTPSGKELTLMNPSYMMRQMHGIEEKEYTFRGHITSLNPIRPENAPDPWEVKALKTFEQGKTEVVSLEKIKDKEYFRLMRPLMVEESCLKCHAVQGYKKGDLRGGISVSILMDQLLAIMHKRFSMLSLSHVVLLLVGLAGIILGMQRFIKSEEERRWAKERYRSIVENAIEGIFQTTPEGKIIIANPAVVQMHGFNSSDEMIATITDLANQLYVIPEKRAEFKRELEKQGFVKGFETQLYRKDRSKIWVSLNARTVCNAKGEVLCYEGTAEDITQRKEMEEMLQTLAIVDELTGLFNRRGFFTLAEQQLKIATRREREMILLYADLDKLKLINDNLGHAEGDRALQETAKILKNTFRESDIIARIGGDEFVVLAVETPESNARILSSHLQGNLEAYNSKRSLPYRLSLSIGTAHFDPASSTTLKELLTQADAVMYEQKREKAL